MAQEYLRIAGLGMAPALVVMVLKSYLAALERTQVVLWATVAALPLNAAVNWALIFGNWGAPELGLQGAAIASVVVQTAGALVLVAYAAWLPALRRYALFLRFWRADVQALGMVFRLGWPIGRDRAGRGRALRRHGADDGLGGHDGARRPRHRGGDRDGDVHGPHGLVERGDDPGEQGVRPRGSRRAGAGRVGGLGDVGSLRRGDHRRVPRGAGAAAGPVPVADEPQRAQIVALGVKLMIFAAAFQAVDGAQVVALGLLRGVQDTRVPMVQAAISYWVVGMPACYVTGFWLGWGAPVCGWALSRGWAARPRSCCTGSGAGRCPDWRAKSWRAKSC